MAAEAAEFAVSAHGDDVLAFQLAGVIFADPAVHEDLFLAAEIEAFVSGKIADFGNDRIQPLRSGLAFEKPGL